MARPRNTSYVCFDTNQNVCSIHGTFTEAVITAFPNGDLPDGATFDRVSPDGTVGVLVAGDYRIVRVTRTPKPAAEPPATE